MTVANVALTRRIAHTLGVPAEELDFLAKVDAESLRTLHAQVVETVFDPDLAKLGGLQNAAKILPPPVTAKVAERALGPVLAGRIAGSLDAGAAIAIARRLPPEFLADVAGHVHPARVEAVVGGLSSRQIDGAADVLVARSDVLALGHFAGVIRADTLQSVAGRLSGAVILDIAPFVEPVERVDGLVELIADPIVLSILRTAHDDNRWGDAFDLVDCLNSGSRTRIAGLAVPESELIDGAVRAAADTDRWTALLSFAALASGVPKKHWNNIDAFGDPEIIDAALSAAERHDLWDPLGILVQMWPASMHKKVVPTLDSASRARLGL